MAVFGGGDNSTQVALVDLFLDLCLDLSVDLFVDLFHCHSLIAYSDDELIAHELNLLVDYYHDD